LKTKLVYGIFFFFVAFCIFNSLKKEARAKNLMYLCHVESHLVKPPVDVTRLMVVQCAIRFVLQLQFPLYEYIYICIFIYYN